MIDIGAALVVVAQLGSAIWMLGRSETILPSAVYLYLWLTGIPLLILSVVWLSIRSAYGDWYQKADVAYPHLMRWSRFSIGVLGGLAIAVAVILLRQH